MRVRRREEETGESQKQPQASDYYELFFIPAITLLVLSMLALFGLRFTPW